MTEAEHERSLLHSRTLALIGALADGSRDDPRRDALIGDIAAHQARHIPAYARFVAQRRLPEHAQGLDRIAAIPTDAFRFARMAAHPESADVRRFQSSGTTQDERSLHAFRDLTLYDLAAEHAARHALFPDLARMQLVIVAPSEQEAPDSSLSYMLARFGGWFATSTVHVVRAGSVDARLLVSTLRDAERDAKPVALLGTSFGFVHLMDALGDTRFALPARSRIMQTGGFKGRSREIAPDAMRHLLSTTFGLDEAWIVAEYGMTELSSQLYENTLREAALGRPLTPRRLLAPPWVRALPVDPDTLLPSDAAEGGLLRVDDAANLDSVACIQTADVAQPVGDGLRVVGRAQGAIARGCSITADELLGRPR